MSNDDSTKSKTASPSYRTSRVIRSPLGRAAAATVVGGTIALLGGSRSESPAAPQKESFTDIERSMSSQADYLARQGRGDAFIHNIELICAHEFAKLKDDKPFGYETTKNIALALAQEAPEVQARVFQYIVDVRSGLKDAMSDQAKGFLTAVYNSTSVGGYGKPEAPISAADYELLRRAALPILEQQVKDLKAHGMTEPQVSKRGSYIM